MGIFSKRFLLLLFFAGIMYVAILRPDQVVKAAEVTRDIYDVSVEITKASESPPTSQIQLRWQAVWPIANGSISYDIWKSTDGGLTFPESMRTNTTALTWIDNSVPDYTNVIYQVRSKEDTTTPNPFSSPVKVFPPNVNIHDNYMSNTNLCSNCHSNHSAKTDKLLNVSASASGFCLTCHDGSGSKYDVDGGYTMTGDGPKPSLGGAFKDALSAHKIRSNDSPMECTDCHSAHWTDSYRMLKSSISGVNMVAGAKADNSSQGETPVYISGTESFCQSCHVDAKFEFTPDGSGHPLNITLTAPMTTLLPLEGNNIDRSTGKMMCLTCHSSHGSTSGNLTVSPENELCMKCHTSEKYGEPIEPDTTTSGFSNPWQYSNLHNFSGSIGGHKDLDCSSCHVSHGNFRKGLLIGVENPITSIDDESGTDNWFYDNCATSCHIEGSGA